MMIRLLPSYWIIVFTCLLSAELAFADKFTSPACRPVRVEAMAALPVGEFKHGLLWEVSKPGREANYLFGTIHVADDEVDATLETVRPYLQGSHTFIMEALPEPQQIMQLQMLMSFSQADAYLYDYLPEDVYRRAVEILGAYHLPEALISKLRPWGAYLTMSYPPSMRQILDEQLLVLAQQSGAAVHGLESMLELADVFTAYSPDEQAQLLIDSVCHYDLLEQDFEKLIDLYLSADLQAMYRYSQRYSFADNTLYEDLAVRLLHARNTKMVQRMQPWLQQGGAFIAIGVLHLPGTDGVLASLKKRGYNIRLVEHDSLKLSDG